MTTLFIDYLRDYRFKMTNQNIAVVIHNYYKFFKKWANSGLFLFSFLLLKHKFYRKNDDFVVLSAPTILWPQHTIYTFFQFKLLKLYPCLLLQWEKDENKQKEAGIGRFF